MSDVLNSEKASENVKESNHEVVGFHTREQWLEFLRRFLARPRRDGEEPLPPLRTRYFRFVDWW